MGKRKENETKRRGAAVKAVETIALVELVEMVGAVGSVKARFRNAL